MGMPTEIYILALFAGFVASQKACPDGSLCNTGDTCCKLRSGKYSCCPLPNAVCCDDQEHCCPSRYRCDNETDACKPSSARTAHVEALVLQTLENTDRQQQNDYVPCGLPDDAVCPAGHTCCTTTPKSKATNHSCCPSRNAVCCADGKHCCPARTTCQPASGRCSYDDAHAPRTGLPAKPHDKMRTTTAVKAIPTECKGGFCATSSSRNTVGRCPPDYYQCSNPVYCCPVNLLCTFTGACVPMPFFVPKIDAARHYEN